MTEFNRKLEICGPAGDVEGLSRSFAFYLYSSFKQFEMKRFNYENGDLEVTFRWND